MSESDILEYLGHSISKFPRYGTYVWYPGISWTFNQWISQVWNICLILWISWKSVKFKLSFLETGSGCRVSLPARCPQWWNDFAVQFRNALTSCYKKRPQQLQIWEFLRNLTSSTCYKGQTASPKRMKLRKSSKRPLTPPPSSLENHIADFATKLRQKCICSLWRDCCVYMILFPIRCM